MASSAPRVGVLFDVGYCLMDETARLGHALAWFADALGASGRPVDRARLGAAYGAVCRRPDPGEPSLLVQMLWSVGVPREDTPPLRRAVPWDAVPLEPYPDALPAIRRLKTHGFLVGVLANQPASAQVDLDRAGITGLCDGVWLSDVVGRAKPDPAFFQMALRAWALGAERVAYVGDRPDNDVAPARALGLTAVRLRRGPHAAQAPRDEGERAAIEADDLAEAVARLIAWQGSLTEDA